MAQTKDIASELTPTKRSGRLTEKSVGRVRTKELFDPHDVPHFRANVGARNPLIIAKRLASPKLLKCFIEVEGNIKKFISLVFKESGIDYSELFDPKYGSPLYHGLSIITEQLREKNDELYSKFLEVLEKDPARKVGVWPAFCQPLTISRYQQSTIGGNPLQYRIVCSYNNGLQFNDPVQGCVADCWFISALSSVAFAEQTYLSYPRKLSRTTNSTYFWPVVAPGQRTRYTIAVSSEYYLDNLGDPYYARTNPIMLVPGVYETWGPCYEKACAGYFEQGQQPPFPTVVQPDYNLLNFNDAFEALSDITGQQYTIATTDYTNNYLAIPPYDGVGIIEELRNGICYMPFDLNKDYQFLNARKPAVAYTYLSDVYVPPAANNNPPFADTVTYDSPGVPANHAFSILGVYQEKDAAGARKYFVVLRNPWGFAGEPSYFNAGLQTGLAGNLASAIAACDVATKINYITNPGSEGIFGLRSDYFMRYFEAFGWVPP